MRPRLADLLDAEARARRRPVWLALSTLYLDTDVSTDLAWRAEALACAPYDIDRLERILLDEVHPVLRWNLLSVAGVWDGFDPGWLEATILQVRPRGPHWPRWLQRWRNAVARSEDWRATRDAVVALRAAH